MIAPPLTRATVEALVGKYVRVTHADGSGGAGRVVRVIDAGSGVFELEVDYGYSFPLLEGSMAEVEEEGR